MFFLSLPASLHLAEGVHHPLISDEAEHAGKEGEQLVVLPSQSLSLVLGSPEDVEEVAGLGEIHRQCPSSLRQIVWTAMSPILKLTRPTGLQDSSLEKGPARGSHRPEPQNKNQPIHILFKSRMPGAVSFAARHPLLLPR